MHLIDTHAQISRLGCGDAKPRVVSPLNHDRLVIGSHQIERPELRFQNRLESNESGTTETAR